MKRRELILLLGGTALASWPLPARAQQPGRRIIGFLNSTSAAAAAPLVAAFRHALSEAGYVEGQNLAIEYRWAEGNYDRLPALATDLVNRKVEVIAASGGDRSSSAAKAASATMPIVSVIGGDPVASGFVASFARPGGNLTGVSLVTVQLMPKRLEILSELVPQAKTVALLTNPDNPQTDGVIKDVQEAARTKGLRLRTLTAGREDQVEAAFADLAQSPVGAMLIQADPFFNGRSDQIVAAAARQMIPTIAEWRGFPAVGGLASYGTSLTGVYHQIGVYVGKILAGAKPADLPVEQPTRFELVINLKTAKALGLTVPQSILARADEVIE